MKLRVSGATASNMIIADAEGKEEDVLTPKTIRNHFDPLRKAQRAAGKPNTTAIQGFIQF